MALLPGLPQGQPQAPQQGAEQPDQSKYVDDAEGNASPEEQAQYEKAVDNALELIYPQGQQGKVEPAVIEQLKAAAMAVKGHPIRQSWRSRRRQ